MDVRASLLDAILPRAGFERRVTTASLEVFRKDRYRAHIKRSFFIGLEPSLSDDSWIEKPNLHPIEKPCNSSDRGSIAQKHTGKMGFRAVLGLDGSRLGHL